MIACVLRKEGNLWARFSFLDTTLMKICGHKRSPRDHGVNGLLPPYKA